MDMKKKVIIFWVIFVVCVIATVALWFAMNNSNPEFEEVTVTVESSKTEQIVNRKTGSRTNIYKVKVRYNGETHDLHNPHNSYQYPEGKSVKAYLSNGKLYANEEGVKTSTPIATIYFVFLFGSFGMLFVALTYTGKLRSRKEKQSRTIRKSHISFYVINVFIYIDFFFSIDKTIAI